MIDTQKIQGDLKIVALAIQALIETHPNKKEFQQAFLRLIDKPNAFSLYGADVQNTFNGRLLQDLLRTANSETRINDQDGPTSLGG